MGMLTKDDLHQIGNLMDQKMDEKFLKLDEKLLTMEERIVDRIVGDVGDMIEQNFLPAVDVMIDEKLAPIKNDIAGINGEIVGMKSSMVTKDYLDEKLLILRGDLTGYDRRLEKKTDVLTDALVARRVLGAADVERLEQARVFPRMPQ